MLRSSALAALFFAAAAHAQSVEGRVVNTISGDPVGKAHVMLRGAGKRFGAMADASGKFSVNPIAQGEYTISAELTGFVAAKAVKVEVGRETVVRDLQVKLIPQGVLTGRVTDADGNPVEHVQVEALRGIRVRSEHTTDANGEFRLAGLPAGSYMVRAVIGVNYKQGPESRSDGSKEDRYTSTWYPGGAEESAAAAVEARAGQEVSGVDIRLVRDPVVRVRGVITGTPKNARESLLTISDFRYGRSERTSGGEFTLWGLARGRYELYAFASDGMGHSVASAPQQIEVAGENLENLVLDMLPEFEVAGRILWDGEQAAGATQVKLVPVHSDWEPVTTDIEADGSFRFAAVDPNRYRVVVEGLPDNVYVKSMRLGAVDMPHAILDVRHGAGQPVAITLSAAGAQISGTVGEPDLAVAIANEDLTFFRTVMSATGGSYSFPGLAPGDYLVFLVDTADAAALPRRGSLGLYERTAENVRVTEGDKVVRNIAGPK
jgi:hypothetical protein